VGETEPSRSLAELALVWRNDMYSRAEERMFAKLAAPGFMTDIRPLLSAGRAELLSEDATRRAFAAVFAMLVSIIPGASWAKTSALKRKFGIV
jgi:hypothetical protein